MKETLELLTPLELDVLYSAIFFRKAWHLTKDGYIYFITLELSKRKPS